MRDRVGEQWKQRLRGKGYPSTGGKRFLRRFQASPYIMIPLQYARLQSDSLILEPGCGSGKFSLALASLGHRVIALDYVFDVLRGVRAAQDRLGELGMELLEGLCQGSLEGLPFPDNTFDLVINEGVVEHWLDREERLKVLIEMVRVTTPGGVVAVIVPNGVHPLIRVWESRLAGFLQAPPMVYYSAEQLIADLLQAGLRDVCTDGIYPWRSLTRVPPWDRLYLVSAFLDRYMPLPRSLRQRWAINLIGLGSKPGDNQHLLP